MKLRCSFSSQKCLFAFGLSFAALMCLGAGALAQDRLQYRDGRTQDVKILGANGTQVLIQVGTGSMGVAFATVTSVTMAPPPEFAPAVTACAAKQYDKALPALKAIADKYKGLPTEWARQATSLVGDIYVAQNKLKEAEAAYKDFQRLYPGAGSEQTEVGMARIAVARKNFAEAKQKLEPIAAKALTQKAPPAGLETAYSQTFLLLGQIAEADQKPAVALENYLRTVTLFAEDRTAVAAAQERVDYLRKQDPTLTVP